MNYDVPCECGRSVGVSGADAGTQRACECGRMVEVPSLRQLRQMAGQAPTTTPELVLTGMLSAGSVPEGDCCAACGTPTDRFVLVRLDCEKSEIRRGGWKQNLSFVLAGLLCGAIPGILYVIYLSRQNVIVDEVGQDVWFDVPLRVCGDCGKGLRGRRLLRAVATVSVYSNLLEKYPRTRAEIVPAGTTKA